MELDGIKIVDEFELIPTNGRKSFYRKAIVLIAENNCQYLKSYSTIVARKDNDGTVHRLYDGWSATTGSHIKSFTGLNKAEFIKLPLEK